MQYSIRVLTAGLVSICAALAAAKPNVIVILADDLGYHDVGFNGCTDVPTPHIDSLAAHGVRCTSGYVSHPFCSPTRAGLMTGRYQQRFGHESNPAYDPADTKLGLPLTETMLPDVLRKAGYATGIVGKWHLGAAPHFLPPARGFDEWYGFPGGGHIYYQAKTGSKEYNVPIMRNDQPVEMPEYLTDALSSEAAAFVRRHRDRPFFLYLAYNAVHTPLMATDKYLTRFASIADEKRRTYAAMLSAMDDGVGQVLQAVREAQLEQNTLIVFFSDNGGPIEPNGSNNAPLRGHKGQLFEGGIRVPFAVQWRGTLAEGGTFTQPVCSIDLLPTALAMADVAPAAEWKLDGVNLLPHLTGQNPQPPHERLHWRTGGGVNFALREGRYKLLGGKQLAPQLFDLEADVGETTDLAASKPELVERLLKRHESWNAELIPPQWESPRALPKKPAAKKPAASA